uniref:Uncharacterized protein n=1 Tax=Panagrolaimus davidi TaxID=227884 RepID=A0A914PMQ2_9BILA
MASSRSIFGESSMYNDSKRFINQPFDSPLGQPLMTENAGFTPLKNCPPKLGFGISSASSAVAPVTFNESSNFVPSNKMNAAVFEKEKDEENEYKPDPSIYGYFIRAFQEEEARCRKNSQKGFNESRSRLNSQRSMNENQ